jgi:hypothetical protein
MIMTTVPRLRATCLLALSGLLTTALAFAPGLQPASAASFPPYPHKCPPGANLLSYRDCLLSQATNGGGTKWIPTSASISVEPREVAIGQQVTVSIHGTPGICKYPQNTDCVAGVTYGHSDYREGYIPPLGLTSALYPPSVRFPTSCNTTQIVLSCSGALHRSYDGLKWTADHWVVVGAIVSIGNGPAEYVEGAIRVARESTAPVVTRVTPDHGPIKGQGPATLEGRHLKWVTSVAFEIPPHNPWVQEDKTLYAHVIADSSSRVKIEIPDLARIGYAMHHSWGGSWSSLIAAHIKLCTRAGCTGTDSAPAPPYTYEGPIITGVEPRLISYKPHLTVKISGQHLADAELVLFFIPEVAIHQHVREYNATLMPGGSNLDSPGNSMTHIGWLAATRCNQAPITQGGGLPAHTPDPGAQFSPSDVFAPFAGQTEVGCSVDAQARVTRVPAAKSDTALVIKLPQTTPSNFYSDAVSVCVEQSCDWETGRYSNPPVKP